MIDVMSRHPAALNRVRGRTADVRKSIARVLRSMDLIAGSFPGGKKRKAPLGRRRGDSWGEIYQQLGLAWEFLALRCRHRNGWRRASGGRDACRACGHIRGV